MVAGMATGCGGSKSDAGSDSTGSDTKTESLSGTITAAGSSALKPLADDAADSFLNENPDVSITIDAGGSGEGLQTAFLEKAGRGSSSNILSPFIRIWSAFPPHSIPA